MLHARELQTSISLAQPSPDFVRVGSLSFARGADSHFAIAKFYWLCARQIAFACMKQISYKSSQESFGQIFQGILHNLSQRISCEALPCASLLVFSCLGCFGVLAGVLRAGIFLVWCFCVLVYSCTGVFVGDVFATRCFRFVGVLVCFGFCLLVLWCAGVFVSCCVCWSSGVFMFRLLYSCAGLWVCSCFVW